MKNSKFSAFDRSNLFLNRSKKWRNSSQSHCLVQLILDSYSISWKEHSIDRKGFSIDQDNEEFQHRVSAWLNWFSIPLQSIERYIRSIETRKNWIFQNFLVTIFDIFIIPPSKTPFSLWSFCLTRSVLDSSLINWKVHSIDQKEFSINRNS